MRRSLAENGKVGSVPPMPLRSLLAVPVACVLAVTTPAVLSLHAQEPPEVVLSDVPAYCIHLQRALADLTERRDRPLPAEVLLLSEEGRRLCEEGNVRAGIMRLRQAMVLMVKGGPHAQMTFQELPAAK